MGNPERRNAAVGGGNAALDLPALTARLGGNAEAIRNLVAGVGKTQARWRPAEGGWSILEVVAHLRDEEREDFRRRLDLVLHHPGAPWPPIAPERWAVERRYQAADPRTTLGEFLAERRVSLAWLRSLRNPDWDAASEHPRRGTMTAGELMAAWVAHDLLHLRQLVRLHWQHLAATAAPYPLDYAGDW